MHAHRTRVTAESARRVAVRLSSDFPEGEADVIVLPAAEHVASGQGDSGLRRPSVDESLASRLTPPPGVGPVSLADVESPPPTERRDVETFHSSVLARAAGCRRSVPGDMMA